MTPVNMAENLLMRIGPSNITFLCRSAGPVETGPALAGIARLAGADDRFSRSVRRALNWHFWTDPAPLDLTRHVAILRAPDIVDDTGTAGLMSAVRRMAHAPGRPRWRALILNPAGEGDAGPGAVSGVIFHIDHVIADGLRLARLFAAHAEAPGDGSAPAATPALDQIGPKQIAQAADPAIDADDVGFVTLPLTALRGRGAAGKIARVLDLGGGLLRDPALFDPAARRSDFAMVARLVDLRTRSGWLANAARMVKVPLDTADGGATRGMLPRLPVEWEYEIILRASVLFPDALLRPLAHAKFTEADQVVTVVPARARQGRLFGSEISGIYALPPAIGRPPLALTATSYGRELRFSVIPGEGCLAPAREIAARFGDLARG